MIAFAALNENFNIKTLSDGRLSVAFSFPKNSELSFQ
jgi:hypothetical protein